MEQPAGRSVEPFREDSGAVRTVEMLVRGIKSKMDVQSAEDRERIMKRLRRIEGQVRGIQGMLDDGRDCREIVQQLSAVRSAVQQVGLEVMRVYAGQCLADPAGAMDDAEIVDYLVSTLGKWS